MCTVSTHSSVQVSEFFPFLLRAFNMVNTSKFKQCSSRPEPSRTERIYCSVKANQYPHKWRTERDIRSAHRRYGSTELNYSDDSARPEPSRTERMYCSVEAKQYHHKRRIERDIRSAHRRYGSTESNSNENYIRKILPDQNLQEQNGCTVPSKQSNTTTNEEQSRTSVPLTEDTAVQN